jgi:DNA helicase HerA-like ATPase
VAGVCWAALITVVIGLSIRSSTAWIFGGVVGVIVGGVVAWNLDTRIEAESWARTSGALRVGDWRNGRFFVSRPFVIAQGERLRHISCSGGTGSGKSTLIRNLAVQDALGGSGFAVIDPKDDLIEPLLGHIPPERLDDVILFDATDRDCPLGLNPLADVPEHQRSLAAAELISVFRRQFADAWGPRQEHILRYAILALLEMPRSTLLDIPALLINQAYLHHVAAQVTNPAVREFLLLEYEQIIRRRGDAIEPILNKIGPWLAYPELRNIIGQQRSSFDFRRVMDTSQILLVRIPQGALGEDASNLLGALVVARLQLAAQSRVDLPPERRRPFYVFADEFQNFVSSSFTKILTEGRAFGLGVFSANQFKEQLPRELQLALAHNAAVFIETARVGGDYVVRVSKRDGNEAGRIVDLRPAGPLGPGYAERAREVRARSRLRYGRPIASNIGSLPSTGNGRSSFSATPWGVDVEEE